MKSRSRLLSEVFPELSIGNFFPLDEVFYESGVKYRLYVPHPGASVSAPFPATVWPYGNDGPALEAIYEDCHRLQVFPCIFQIVYTPPGVSAISRLNSFA